MIHVEHDMDKEIKAILDDLAKKNNKSRTFRRASEEIGRSHQMVALLIGHIREIYVSDDPCYGLDEETYKAATEIENHVRP